MIKVIKLRVLNNFINVIPNEARGAWIIPYSRLCEALNFADDIPAKNLAIFKYSIESEALKG
jgi:hypothetical protein